MKIDIDMLSVEITRKCNMHCAHCMRGDAENENLNVEKADAFFSQISSVGELTMTGGEPSLNVDGMKALLDIVKKHNVYVCGFYVVTNGKELSADFFYVLLQWYEYCISCGGETELCGVALSRDKYHETIEEKNLKLLRGLSFFCESDKNFSKKFPGLIDIGRARKILDEEKRRHAYDKKISVEKYYNGDIYVEDILTLTVDGNVLTDCDYAYEDTNEVFLCKGENIRKCISNYVSQEKRNKK